MSKDNNKLTTIVTPMGTALYPYLRTTERFNGTDTGKYSIQIKLSEKDTAELMERLDKEWEAAKQSPDFAGKSFRKGTVPNLGYRADKAGDAVFKAKTNATIRTKTGEVLHKTVPIFDAKGKPIKGDIGYGSTVRLSITLAPYATSSTNYGLALYLNGVQVIKMVEKGSFGASAESFGFHEEEGYTAEEEDSVDEVPFDTNEEEDF